MPTHYYCDEGTDEDPTPVHRCNQNEPTNHPAPVILDEAALAEIEARKAYQYGTMVSLTVAERDALCNSLRAAWRDRDRALTPSIVDSLRLLDGAGYGKEVPNSMSEMIKKVLAENASLRTRIAELAAQWCQCGHAKDKHGFFSDHDECYECDQAAPDLCCEWRPVPHPNQNTEESDLVRRIDACIRFTVPIQQQGKLRSAINDLILLNTSLRELLACRTVELAREGREMQKWNNRANQLAIEGQELRQRLAQVEKERDHYKRLYEL